MEPRRSVEELILSFIVFLGIFFPFLMFIFDVFVHFNIVTITLEAATTFFFVSIFFVSKKKPIKPSLYLVISIFLVFISTFIFLFGGGYSVGNMMTILLAVVGVVLMSSDRNLKFFILFLPILLGTFVLVECIYPGIRQEDGRMAYKFMLVFDMEFWVSSTAILYLTGKVKNLYDINRNVIVSFSEELHAKNDELQVLTEELRAQGEELQSQNDQIMAQNEILEEAMGELKSKKHELELLNLALLEKNDKLLEFANEIQQKQLELKVQNLQISSQNELLGETMMDLRGKQAELENLNNHLEKIVSKRTELLKEKNIKLASYAFFNSHILRAPVCRIQGLINLINTDESKTEQCNKVYHELLDESVRELGFITSKTSKLLDTHEEVSQKEIELLFDEVFEGKKHVF